MHAVSREPPPRFVIVLDQSYRVVARQAAADPLFGAYAQAEYLPEEVERLARTAKRSSSSAMLSDGVLLHILRLAERPGSYVVLIFEQARAREAIEQEK